MTLIFVDGSLTEEKVCLLAEAYEFPVLSKSIETETAIVSGRGAEQNSYLEAEGD